jgi:hypothetical protein
MTFDRIVLTACFVLVTGGCGREDARSPEPSHQPVPVVEPAGHDRVPKRPSNADVRAELEAAQAKDAAHAAGENPNAIAGDAGTTTRDTYAAAPGTDAADGGAPPAANVASDAERRDFETKARERIAKIDARARELQQKGTKLTATKKTSFETSFRRFTTDRTDAGSKVDALGRSGAGWKAARTSVERSLDDLEAALAKLDDQM